MTLVHNMAEYTASEGSRELYLGYAEKAYHDGKWEKAGAAALIALVHHLRNTEFGKEIDRLMPLEEL